MTKPVVLPPISVTKGIAFFQRYLFEDSGGPIDLTGWTGAFSLSKRPFEKPFFEGECVLGGTDGDVRVSISVEDIAAFEVNPILGGSPVASFQIYLEAPDPTQNQVWQGPAKIAGIFTS